MSADETAQFLNDHFTLLAEEVEATGGVIDKYIGDSLMAFWGAPDAQADHAANACAAARAIRRRLTADNQRRRAEGQPPCRVRVGLHTGEVVVGNIGAKGRVNYTAVGDAVNVASRLEAGGKQLANEESGATPDVVILASAATVQAAGLTSDTTAMGERAIPGRSGQVSVYRL